MFLDLCLQIFLQQTKNNKIMKSIQKYIIQQRKRKKIPKGFKTNLSISKNYIQNFLQYIKSNHSQLLDKLNQPIGPTAQQMLKFMRQYDQQQSDIQLSEQQQLQNSIIISINLFNIYEQQPINKINVQKYYQDQEKQKSRLNFLTSLKHIHNKAIFDSLNQSLDFQRSYGIWGKPFPWKKQLSLNKNYTLQEKYNKLRNSADKVIQNLSYFCGVLIDKQDNVFGNTIISEEYLNHLREDRMSKMLSNDLLENQCRWTFYTDQQAQILVQLSKFVTKSLIQQVCLQIIHLFQ